MNPIMDALKVLVWDRRTRAFLRENDPKALEQADKALKDAGEAPACGWDGLDGPFESMQEREWMDRMMFGD
jgi:hypothetical protein